MSKAKSAPRRTRVPGERNANIYRRPDDKLEVGYRDSSGAQRWQSPFDTITEARAWRDDTLARRGRGERVRPNPRLRFDEAADRWLTEQVAGLRPATQSIYRIAVDVHLRGRWASRRLDEISVDDVARLVRELRAAGKSEWTIAGVVKVAGRVFAFAQRRCSWHGENPVRLLEGSERPKVSLTARRRIFQGDELAQTLAVAGEPFRTLFAVAAVTGARLSELLGLVWSDVDLRDLDDPVVSFTHQVDVRGVRQALKTEESRRVVELPRQLAVLLLEHRARSPHSSPSSFVFATRSGRPLGQRNVLRELRRAMRAACDERGRATFVVLQEAGAPPRGSVPNFHSFRHTAASEAIAAGDGAEEVSWQLGHKNSNVTRAVYVQEIKNVERRARRRARMEARYGSLVEATGRSSAKQAGTGGAADVVDLSGIRRASK